MHQQQKQQKLRHGLQQELVTCLASLSSLAWLQLLGLHPPKLYAEAWLCMNHTRLASQTVNLLNLQDFPARLELAIYNDYNGQCPECYLSSRCKHNWKDFTTCHQ